MSELQRILVSLVATIQQSVKAQILLGQLIADNLPGIPPELRKTVLELNKASTGRLEVLEEAGSLIVRVS